MARIEDAIGYAEEGWEIFPLRGKIPAIAKIAGGNGVLDATSDITTITAWWTAYPYHEHRRTGPPERDRHRHRPSPRRRSALLDVANPHGGMPETLTCLSGRGDGGRHRYLLHPGGQLNEKRLPDGVDLKTHAGYVVLPEHPSRQRDALQVGRTARNDRSLPDMAGRAAPPCRARTGTNDQTFPGRARLRQHRRLVHPHDNLGSDPRRLDRSNRRMETPDRYLPDIGDGPPRPAVRVQPQHPPLDPTKPGSPHGYTRFRAWAVLHHQGDLSAAARQARTLRDSQQVNA